MNQGTVSLTGIITSSSPAGEYDRRITIISAERGKVTAFVRGARRPKSQMIASTNLFCFGKFSAYEGRETYTVVKAEINNFFRELSEDIDRTYYGCYFLELANYFCRENEDCKIQIQLLYAALRALCRDNPGKPLVRRIYELRLLSLFGVSPNLSSCASCGSSENLTFFNPRRHGCVCAECGGTPGCISIDASVLYTLKYIVSSPIKKLFGFNVSDHVFSVLDRVVDDYLELFVDKKLKTKVFLK